MPGQSGCRRNLTLGQISQQARDRPHYKTVGIGRLVYRNWQHAGTKRFAGAWKPLLATTIDNALVDQVLDLSEHLIGFAFMAGVPGYFVLQPWTVLRLPGGWRKAALVPLIGAIPTIMWSLYALSQESNLWPLTFILFAPLGTLYLAILMIAYRAASRAG